MISKHSELRVDVKKFLSHKEKLQLIEQLKAQYGVSKVKINDIGSSNQTVSSQIQNSIQDDVKLHQRYEEHLSNKKYDKKLFEQIDQEVLSYMPDLKEDHKKNYRIKYFKGKNILSFGNFEFDVFGLEGINVVYSDPENFGGKSNFYKLFQILLWGEYVGVGTKSTINSLPNKFLKQDAYIEGIVQIEDKLYFIRRDYTKKGKKYDHHFNIFLLTDQLDADCFLINDEYGLETIDLSAHNPSIDGFFAKNLNTKNSAEAKKEFIDQIGTLSDFKSNCYFDQLNINSLLLEKPTARTREFYNLFGGKYFEKKKEIAKDTLYKKFKEKSVIHQHDLADVKNIIKEKQDLLKTYESNKLTVSKSVEQLEQQIRKKNVDKDALIYQLKDVEEIDVNDLKLKKEEKQKELELIKRTLKEITVNNSFSYTQTDYDSFKQVEKALYDKIDNVKIDKKISDKIESLKDVESKDERIISLNKLIKENSEEKLQVKVDFNTVKKTIEDLKKQINELDAPQKCPHCGKNINDVEEQKRLIEDDIKNAEERKSNLLKYSHELVKQASEYEEELVEIKRKYEQQLNNLHEKADIYISNRKKELNDELKEIRQKIENFNKQREIENNVNSYKNKIRQRQDEIKSIDLKISQAKANDAKIKHNQQLRLKIKDVETQINSLDKMLKEHYQRLNVISSDISRTTLIVEQKQELLRQLSDDIKKDAAYQFYIKVHDKDGIIKDIIAGYLGEINAQLKEPLNDMHFNVEIRQIKGVIEYFKIDKESGIVMPLSDASNFERFISISALHLIRLKYSTAVLSNIIFFDEVFAQTHDVNVPILYSSLEQYKELFELVLVISHRDTVKKLADNEIKIEKQNNISKIEKY